MNNKYLSFDSPILLKLWMTFLDASFSNPSLISFNSKSPFTLLKFSLLIFQSFSNYTKLYSFHTIILSVSNSAALNCYLVEKLENYLLLFEKEKNNVMQSKFL